MLADLRRHWIQNTFAIFCRNGIFSILDLRIVKNISTFFDNFFLYLLYNIMHLLSEVNPSDRISVGSKSWSAFSWGGRMGNRISGQTQTRSETLVNIMKICLFIAARQNHASILYYHKNPQKMYLLPFLSPLLSTPEIPEFRITRAKRLDQLTHS